MSRREAQLVIMALLIVTTVNEGDDGDDHVYKWLRIQMITYKKDHVYKMYGSHVHSKDALIDHLSIIMLVQVHRSLYFVLFHNLLLLVPTRSNWSSLWTAAEQNLLGDGSGSNACWAPQQPCWAPCWSAAPCWPNEVHQRPWPTTKALAAPRAQRRRGRGRRAVEGSWNGNCEMWKKKCGTILESEKRLLGNWGNCMCGVLGVTSRLFWCWSVTASG
jgi:hypothetical protein